MLCGTLFVPGIVALPPVDRDEPRFAQASRQMVESGDYVRIRFQDKPRHQKPIGIYWLQTAAVRLVRERNAIWPYRLPGLLAATLAVIGTLGLGRVLFDEAAARLGAALLAASVLLGVEARLATADAVVLLTVVAAQLALARAYLSGPRSAAGPWSIPLLFWSALGIGTLVKGPITAMIVALTVLALARTEGSRRWLHRLRPAIGIPIALAIVLPWTVAIAVATRGEFFWGSIGRDLLPKLVSGQQGHGGPPGYYAALFPTMFWPGSAFALLAVPWIWRHRADPAVRFALAWIVPAWLVFELTVTKLPHYVLPLYPAVALLAARAAGESLRPWASWPGRVVLAVWAAAGLALASALVLFPLLVGGSVSVGGVVGAVLTIAALGIALGGLLRGRPRSAAAAMVAGAVALSLTATVIVLPRLPVWISRDVYRAVTAEVIHRGLADPPVASAGFPEPSLVFLLGTTTILTTGEGAADHLAADARALAVVEAQARPAFQARLSADGIVATPVAAIHGYNYSTGRRVSVELYGR